MQSIDLKILGERLQELTEIFDRKPLTERAVRGWFDALREFPVEKVAGVLLGWPKQHSKFPAPADVWKVCNEIAIVEREKRLAADRAVIEKQVVQMGSTPQGKAIIANLKAVLRKPKRTPREHWQSVLDNADAPWLAREYAKEALKRWGQVEREPGADDEALEIATQA